MNILSAGTGFYLEQLEELTAVMYGPWQAGVRVAILILLAVLAIKAKSRNSDKSPVSPEHGGNPGLPRLLPSCIAVLCLGTAGAGTHLAKHSQEIGFFLIAVAFIVDAYRKQSAWRLSDFMPDRLWAIGLLVAIIYPGRQPVSFGNLVAGPLGIWPQPALLVAASFANMCAGVNPVLKGFLSLAAVATGILGILTANLYWDVALVLAGAYGLARVFTEKDG